MPPRLLPPSITESAVLPSSSPLPSLLFRPRRGTSRSAAFVRRAEEDLGTMAAMTNQEMGSPGSASGFAQDAPTIIRIPFRAILDIVLAKLGIPEAEYRREICDGNKICVTVLFDTSTLNGAPARMSISGAHSTDDEEAEDTAALKAIEYLETAANVVIRDYSYDKMKRLEEETKRLMEQLEEANDGISKLVRAWLLAVRCICSFSRGLKLLLGKVSWMRL